MKKTDPIGVLQAFCKDFGFKLWVKVIEFWAGSMVQVVEPLKP
jgi:hypothetical protein